MGRFELARPKDVGLGCSSRTNVVVVGAGLAGLTAALDLVESGVEDVVLLEARGRVGGRTLNKALGKGSIVEAGGEWVGPSQTEILALAERLGVGTFRTYDSGDTVYHFDGVRTRGPYPPLAEEELAEFARAKASIDRLAAEVPLVEPWLAPLAAPLDGQSVDAWLRRNITNPNVRALISGIVYGALGGAAEAVSLLWFLFCVHSAGGIEALIATSGGAQDSRFTGGSQEISIRLAALLGDRVILRSPVRRIAQLRRGRVVVASQRMQIEARRVIIAMMPTDVQQIDFVPSLPLGRRRLIREWPAATGLKANLGYEGPFWRDERLSGQALTEDYFTYDNSPPDGSCGVLVVSADPTRLPRSRRARRKAIVMAMAVLFGNQARRPAYYVEMNWGHERWNAGCVSPLPPGLITSVGPWLHQPIGNIHWAGTETSDVWNGYMEGAVRSGRRAAREVLAAL